MDLCIPILMYHSITRKPPATTRRLSVDPVAFSDQLAHLDDQGFTPLTLSSLGRILEGDSPLPDRPVVLTFDDGYADFHREALPVLSAHGFVASLFVTTGWIDDAGETRAGRPLDRMLAWSQIQEASTMGVEVCAHSHSHAALDQLRGHILRNELQLSKHLLEERLGREVESFAYPYGYSSARVRQAARTSGYRYACVVGNALASPESDLFTLPRLTVRRSTSMTTFDRIVNSADVSRIFFKDRVLTRGYAAVRHAAFALQGSRT